MVENIWFSRSLVSISSHVFVLIYIYISGLNSRNVGTTEGVFFMFICFLLTGTNNNGDKGLSTNNHLEFSILPSLKTCCREALRSCHLSVISLL